MIWSGKLIAGSLGTLIGGPLAGLLAAGVGHTLDREVEGFSRAFDRQRSTRWRQYWHEVLFKAEFLLAGYLFCSARARAQDADACFEALVGRHALTGTERGRARAWFEEGQRPEFPLTAFVNQVRRETHRQRELVQQLLSALLSCLDLEGRRASEDQRQALADIARRFAVSEEGLAWLASAAHEHRRQTSARPSASVDQTTAYAVLGVSPDATEAEVRRAYRTQMSRHHPDKLMHLDPSDERLAQAASRTDLIRKAYESIKRARGW